MQLLDLNTTPCPVHDDAEQLEVAVAAGNATLAREDWAERTATPNTTPNTATDRTAA